MFWQHLNIINEKVLEFNSGNELALQVKNYINKDRVNLNFKILLN